MRFSHTVEQYRIRQGPMRSNTGDKEGAFIIPGPNNRDLTVIASSGDDEIAWEHVSVSTPKGTPTWNEMCFIKDLYFDPNEAVMQLHPPKIRYINNHPYCLHLWRPLTANIPMPPDDAVGYKELGTLPLPNRSK